MDNLTFDYSRPCRSPGGWTETKTVARDFRFGPIADWSTPHGAILLKDGNLYGLTDGGGCLTASMLRAGSL